MTSVNPTIQELEFVKKRISESMQEVQQKQDELQATMELINMIPKASQDQMLDSASNSRKKRKKKSVVSSAEYSASLEAKVAATTDAIARLWHKIHELQTQERELRDAGQSVRS